MAVQLAKIFQDHMILQREKEIAIWGTGIPGKTVEAFIQNQTGNTVVKEDGSFVLHVPALRASEIETLTIKSEDEILEISDVAVGEVWLAGGQSNMEFYMHYEKHFEEEKVSAENSNIRFFDVPKVSYKDQETVFDYSEFARWRKATESDLEWFSGVGYFFSKYLCRKLDIPVGVIGCNFGGTASQSWMKPESVEKVGRLWMQDYDNQMKQIETSGMTMEEYWELHRTYKENDKGHPFENDFNNMFLYQTPPFEECMQYFKNKVISGQWDMRLNGFGPEAVPGALYNYMLKTVAPYSIRGFLFYQGESDEKYAEIYSIMLTQLISDWRELWNENLPFLQVQLPGFHSWMGAPQMKWKIIREQQKAVSDAVDQVYMTSISDAGEELDIHPKDKQTPGERLALLSLGKVYGRNICCEAPVANEMKIEGKSVTITFLNAEGLHIEGESLDMLTVTPKKEYRTEIAGNALVLHFEEAVSDLRVDFAQNGFYKVNLYNEEGVPAMPFSLGV